MDSMGTVMIRSHLCYSNRKARLMRDQKIRVKKLRASLKDLLYTVVCLIVITGAVKSVVSFISLIKPVEAVQHISSKVIEVPVETQKVIVKEVKVKVTDTAQPYDVWVGESVDKYFKGGQASEMRMVMHCLLSRESTHGLNKGLGDGGAAGGPLQFHQGTWNTVRASMIKAGVATEIGDRFDMQQAIEATAYAISIGRGLEWGPLLREARGGSLAKCPLPSFMKK